MKGSGGAGLQRKTCRISDDPHGRLCGLRHLYFRGNRENPAFLNSQGTSLMGETPDFSIGTGEAAGSPRRNASGRRRQRGHDRAYGNLDSTTIEVYRSAARANMSSTG